MIRFIRYSQDSLLDLFQTQTWMRTLAGGVLLFLVASVYRTGHMPSPQILEEILWSRWSMSQFGLLIATQVLSLALVLSGFGTIGLFWPLFMIGGLFGYGINHWVLGDISGFNAAAGLIGGAALWGAIFGAPVAGGVLAFEMSHNLQILLPALAAGFLAREIRYRSRVKPLIEKDLEARGLKLIEGRSASVLDSIHVREAMNTDHETVHEQEPVSELYHRLIKSRYPFFPVVTSQGAYRGLLTIDMVQEAWQSQEQEKGEASSAVLGKLLEAKDLLYRSGFKTATVKVNDRLTATAGVFNNVPCVPVLGDDGRVLGLLFVYNVRLAYDREVARRSLSLENREE
jgi:CBS domain-containing protein